MGCGISAKQVSEAIVVPAFPFDGVTLEQLDDFVQIVGKENIRGMDTADVLETHIKPQTSAFACSYTQLLRRSTPAAVRTATVFISHAWECDFLDMVRMLKSRFKGRGDVVMWIDVFCNNQHNPPATTPDALNEVINPAIRSIGYTVLVLSPLSFEEATHPLKRTWCLYEMYQSTVLACRVEVAVREKDILHLLNTVGSNRGVMPSIDIDASETSFPEDKANILAYLKASKLSSVDVNRTVADKVNEFIITAAEIMIHNGDVNEIGAKLAQYDSLAALYLCQSNYEKAETIYRQCLQIRKTRYGVDHEDTVATKSALASVLKLRGRHSEADPLYQECLEASEEVLSNAPRTRTSIGSVAKLYEIQGRYREAEELYTESLTMCRDNLGEDHSETLAAKRDVAGVLKQQGKFSEAESFIKDVVERLSSSVGEHHRETLWALGDLARLYHLQGRYRDFEALFHFCANSSEEQLGLGNDDAEQFLEALTSHYESVGLSALNKLAYLYTKLGKYEEAGRVNAALSEL